MIKIVKNLFDKRDIISQTCSVKDSKDFDETDEDMEALQRLTPCVTIRQTLHW